MIAQRAWLITALCGIVYADGLPEGLKSSGMQHFYNLEFDEALAEFSAFAMREPASLQAHNQVAQALVFRALFRAGSLDFGLVGSDNAFLRRPVVPIAPEDEKLLLSSLARTMSLAQARIDRDKKDISAIYSLGSAYAIRANYNFAVKKSYIAALRDIAQARKLHARVVELNPQRVDARLIQGLHMYIAGSLGFPWKQIGYFAGLRGDKELGIRTIRQVAESAEANSADASLLMGAIYRREQRPAEGIPFIEKVVAWFPRSYLFRFEQARLYAESGNAARAQAIINEIEQLKRTGAQGYQRVPEDKLRTLKEEIARVRTN